MSSETNTTERLVPQIERTNHTTGLYEAAFGDLVKDARVIADLGSGDSPFAEDYMDQGKEVFRIDPQYAEVPPADTRNALPNFADDVPLPDHTVDVSVSAFMFQHVPKEKIGDILHEASRITKFVEDPAEGGSPDVGGIAVFPVYKGDALREALTQAGLDEHAIVGFPDEEKLSGRHRKLFYPTLAIRNSPELFEPDEDGKTPFDTLVETLEETEALHRTSPTARMSKALRVFRMRRRGDTRFDTRGV